MAEARKKIEEHKKCDLIPGLRVFEVSIISRFLTAKQKLTVCCLLNRSWLHSVYLNYFWSCFPLFPPHVCNYQVLDFMKKFETFGGVEVPQLKIQLIKFIGIDKLSSAEKLSITGISSSKEFLLLKKIAPLHMKLRSLTLTIFNSKMEFLHHIISQGLTELVVTFKNGKVPSLEEWKNAHKLKRLSLIIERSFYHKKITKENNELDLSGFLSLQHFKGSFRGISGAQVRVFNLPKSLRSLILKNNLHYESLREELDNLASLRTLSLNFGYGKSLVHSGHFPASLEELTMVSLKIQSKLVSPSLRFL